METAHTHDTFGTPSPIGPYESSSPTSFGDLTKGEIQYIKDVETLALLAAKTKPISTTVPPSDPLDLFATPLHSPSDSPPPYTLENFPPLQRIPSPNSTDTPRSPLTTPSFSDPTLLKALDIFTDKYPLSPLVLRLNSIRFKNVTIQKSRKGKPSSSQPPSGLYTPLSAHIKALARAHSPSQALRAKSPVFQVDP